MKNQKIPNISNLFKRIMVRLKGYFFFRGFDQLDTEARFTKIYQKRWWGNSGSVSGQGSVLANTENLRAVLPGFLEKYNVSTFLDAPCGDWFWLQHMSFPNGVTYIGADIVEELVAENSRNYASDKIQFQKCDITSDDLPGADMWMCRDCLFHLSEDLVLHTLENFVKSGIPYLLTSSHPAANANRNIITGQMRLINLHLSPYNLPEPIDEIVDYTAPRPQKHLMLWSNEQIKAALSTHSNSG